MFLESGHLEGPSCREVDAKSILKGLLERQPENRLAAGSAGGRAAGRLPNTGWPVNAVLATF